LLVQTRQKLKNIAEKFRDCNQLVKKKVKLISQKG